jgi:hypothetical protein
MAQANFFAPGFDDQIEAQNIERQRRYAELLRDQSQQQPQGQMVSGHFVAPSWTQSLAQVLKAYQGGKGMREADAKQKALAEAVRGRTAEEMGTFTKLLSGAPAQATGQQYQTGANEMGDEAATVPQWSGAQKPDINAAYQFAAGAKTPALQQAGLQGTMQMAQQRGAQEQAAAQQQRILGIIQSAGSPQAAIAAGAPPELVKQFYEARNLGRDKVTFQDVGGEKVAVTEYGDRPAGVAPLQKTGNPFSDLVVRDQNGNIVPNAPLASTKAGIARAGKPEITVDARNYNTQESEQSKVYGKQLGEIRGTITQAGIDAPKRIAQIDRMDELLKGIDGGRFAPAGAEVASAANSLGIKLDPKLGNKQAAEALAIEMALKMRQPGSGPMTDKDFDNFLKTVPSLAKTSEGRAQISQTMRAALQRDVEAAKFSREYAKKNGGVIDDNYFEALADFYNKNPVVTPQMPATNARGKVFQDADAILNRGKK